MKKILSIAIIVVAIFALTIPAFASAGGRTLWVNTPNGNDLFVRRTPSGDSAKLAQLPCGTPVEAVRKYNSGWTKVNVGGVSGYIRTKYLKAAEPDKYGITERKDTFTAVTPYLAQTGAGQAAALYRKPNNTTKAVRRLYTGSLLQVTAEGTNWDKVIDLTTGKTGYVEKDLIQAV